MAALRDVRHCDALCNASLPEVYHESSSQGPTSGNEVVISGLSFVVATGRHDNRLLERSWDILISSFVFRLFSYRYTITMSVRTYNPSVLIGNWNEDVCLEEVGIFEQFHAIYCEGIKA